MTFANGEAADSDLTLHEHLKRERETELLAAQAYPFRTDKCSASLEKPLAQTVFACLTCAGLKGYCYACHIECHTDHEVVELGVRRGFVCDCNTNCQLKRTRMDAPSHKNAYNSPHNFEGRFCWCNTNPDEVLSEEESTMFQCLVCEDWFHDRCIEDLPTDTSSFVDFVCRDCVGKGAEFSGVFCTERKGAPSSTNVFLAEGWRDSVCKCPTCMDHIRNHKLAFVLNPPDIYEPERDANAGLSIYDLGIKALASIPPDRIWHGLAGMKRLKTALSARLKEIEAENRSVTVGDVQLFFADFNRTRATL